MATYDPVLARSPQFQTHSDARYDRGFGISWSGIVAGTALGWATFSLLTLIGAAIGLAKMDPYSTNPANGMGAGSGIYGALTLIVSSFVGAYFAVRIAGDRRRSEALLHGALSWAFSMLIGAMLALGAARTAAQSAAEVASGPRAQARAERETNIRRNAGGATQADRDRAAEASNAAAKATGAGAGGAFLGLVSALIGSLAAARRRKASDRSAGMKQRKPTADFRDMPPRHDETVIVPPGA